MTKEIYTPYLDEKFKPHLEQLNLDSFILHLQTLYALRPLREDQTDFYLPNKDWRYNLWQYNMLCLNLYLLKLESQCTDSDKFSEKNKNIKALIQGLQFFIVSLYSFKEIPAQSVVTSVFKYCLAAIESKDNDGQVDITRGLLSEERKFITYLNNVPVLQKQLDEVVRQIGSIESDETSSSEAKIQEFIAQERLKDLKTQQSYIIKLLHSTTLSCFPDNRRLSIDSFPLAKDDSSDFYFTRS